MLQAAGQLAGLATSRMGGSWATISLVFMETVTRRLTGISLRGFA